MTAHDEPLSLTPEQTLPTPLPGDPLPIFRDWFDDAHRRAQQPNPNAMTLATVDPDGRPSARIVLCKDIDAAHGYVTFHTNRLSRKGRALAAHPEAALVFHWDHTDRQVRIEGPVVIAPDEESDAYFQTRSIKSRLGAWASRQSEPLDKRATLVGNFAKAATKYGVDIAKEVIAGKGPARGVPRPPHWGGYRVWARSVELWTGSTIRLHDRAVWQRDLTPDGPFDFKTSAWRSTRLFP